MLQTYRVECTEWSSSILNIGHVEDLGKVLGSDCDYCVSVSYRVHSTTSVDDLDNRRTNGDLWSLRAMLWSPVPDRQRPFAEMTEWLGNPVFQPASPTENNFVFLSLVWAGTDGSLVRNATYEPVLHHLYQVIAIV